jgi:hypothetical protein
MIKTLEAAPKSQPLNDSLKWLKGLRQKAKALKNKRK